MPRPFPSGGEVDLDSRTKVPVEIKDGESELRGRQKDGLPAYGSSTWRESEFQLWLEQKLAAERGAFILRFQSVMREQLSCHHNALLEEIEGHVGRVPSSAGPKSSHLDKVRENAIVSVSTDSPGSLALDTPASPPSLLASPESSSRGDHSVHFEHGAPPSTRCVKPVRSEGSAAAAAAVKAVLSQKYEDRGAACSRSSSRTPPCSANTTPSSTKTVGERRHSYKSPYLSYLSPSRTRLWLGGGEKNNPFVRVVLSHQFEFACCCLILLNMLVMSFEVQYTGCGLAHQMEHPDSTLCQIFDEVAIDTIFNVLAVVFCLFFTIEFSLRLFAKGREAIKCGWMWFDLIVLTFGIADTMGRLGSQLDLAVNPSAMRTARVARMLRLVKVFRGKEAFQVFFLLIKSLLASRHALGWSLSILFVAMTCTGLLLNQLLYTYLADPSHPASERRMVFDYFGTYTRMIITMFEITLGNWAPPTRILMENISQGYGVFITLYRGLFCFALVNVSAAVFITETSRVASDDEVLMMRKQRTEKRTAQVLEEVFTEIDTSCDGVMTLEELRTALEDNLMVNLLEILELDGRDMEELFNVMDDKGEGSVAREDFIEGILRLRGQAKTSKLVAMMMLVKSMNERLLSLSHQVSSISTAIAGGAPLGKGKTGGS